MEEISEEQIAKLSDFSEFENVNNAFAYLTSAVTDYFTDKKFHEMKRAYFSQTRGPGAVKLPPDIENRIKASTDVNELLDALADSSYWSWIDLQLLRTMVAASCSPTARMLLARYEKYLTSKKLFDILPNAPSIKIKREYYSRVATKLEREDEEDITVGDLLKFRSQLEEVIMDINKGTCILDHFEGGCIAVYWYIPISCVDHAYQSASCKRHKFRDFQLQYIQIGNHPPIHDPSTDKLQLVNMWQHNLPDTAGNSMYVHKLLCITNNYFGVPLEFKVVELLISDNK